MSPVSTRRNRGRPRVRSAARPATATTAFRRATGSRASAIATWSARPVLASRSASARCGTTPTTRLAPALRAAARLSEPDLPAAPITATVGPAVAQDMDVPYAVRDVFLDNDPSRDAVDARLAETEAIARRHGHAVAIGHPHDGTLDALEAWLDEVTGKGFLLVPISAIVRRQLEKRRNDRI